MDQFVTKRMIEKKNQLLGFSKAAKSRTDLSLRMSSEILHLMWSRHLIFTQMDQ